PTRTSLSWTTPVKPCGGDHFAIAAGSTKARYTRSGGARSTRCRVTVPVLLFASDMLGLLGGYAGIRRTARPGIDHPAATGVQAARDWARKSWAKRCSTPPAS